MNENIKLIKRDGKIINNIKANIQRDKIYIDEPIKVEEGDIFEWINLLGIKEQLFVECVESLKDRSHDFHHIEISYHKLKE